LYSDLLMHDMGGDLASEAYGAFVVDAAVRPPAAPAGHSDSEWRTPPLWGVASSAPYLHDGRAATLRDAIAAHEGQADVSAKLFSALAPLDKQELIEFLRSLVAPAGAERVPSFENSSAGWGVNRSDRLARQRQRQLVADAQED
jgi:CxxC motif-containing protein (DUF1111 family)